MFGRGYLTEDEKQKFRKERGEVPLCCVRLSPDGEIKCDSSPFMSKKEFREYCLKCQTNIADRLKLLEDCYGEWKVAE